MAFCGLSIAADDLSDHFHHKFCIVTVVEIQASNSQFIVVTDLTQRKNILSAMVLVSVDSFSTGFIPMMENVKFRRAACGILGKGLLR